MSPANHTVPPTTSGLARHVKLKLKLLWKPLPENPRVSFDVLDLLVLALIWLHVAAAPFTKVEESFNTQATHDLLFHRMQLQLYDHFEFPGVVPRTFLGAILVSSLSSPFVLLSHALGLTKIAAMGIVRCVLGFLVFLSFHGMRTQISVSFGPPTSRFFFLLLLAQFHLPFYASRPLPNVFALAVANLAYTFWLKGKADRALQMLVFAFVVFRCDMLILIAPIGLSMLTNRSISFPTAVRVCVLAGIGSLVLTVSLDSLLWHRFPLWPEGAVLFFNTAMNKSKEWGVSSFHWYFTSALPRALLVAFPLALISPLLHPRLLPFLSPALAFVCLYSWLPHKELRFLFPALPLFNLSAAHALSRLHSLSSHHLAARLAYAAAVAGLGGSFLLSLFFSLASYRNYPGGHAALMLLQQASSPGPVHVSVLPAMTGFTRYCQGGGEGWSYSKDERLEPNDFPATNFTYLLSPHPSIPSYVLLASANGFTRIATKWMAVGPWRLPMPSLESEPQVFIHQRSVDSAVKAPNTCSLRPPNPMLNLGW